MKVPVIKAIVRSRPHQHSQAWPTRSLSVFGFRECRSLVLRYVGKCRFKLESGPIGMDATDFLRPTFRKLSEGRGAHSGVCGRGLSSKRGYAAFAPPFHAGRSWCA